MIGSLGVPELLFILALALLIFGPRKLPEIGRTMGRAMAEFRKASTELRRTLNTEVLEEEIRRERQQLNEAIRGEEQQTTLELEKKDEPAVKTPVATVARGSSPSEDPVSEDTKDTAADET